MAQKEKPAAEPKITPMMRQYLTIKEQNPDCLLFYRLGDFYEMFREDAILASRELDLTLTTRDRGKPPPERTPMCGVPYHSAQAYIARLIAKGYKVAICEQLQDPATTKGLVDRDIVRVVTPGTVVETAMLDETANNFICSVYMDSVWAGAAFCDVSTGECWATAAVGDDRLDHLTNELARFEPKEAVLSDGAMSCTELTTFLRDRLGARVERGGEYSYRPDAAKEAAARQFPTVSGNPEEGETAAIQAVGGLLSFLKDTQKIDLLHLKTLNLYTGGQFMELDPAARRNLELTETLRGGEKKGSLLWVLDKAKTAMGHRLIRSWLTRPLVSPAQIDKRLDAVSALVGDLPARDDLAAALREISDLERLVSRLVYGTANGRDLVGLSAGLGKLPLLRQILTPFSCDLLSSLRQEMDDLPELRAELDAALADEPPLSVREGGFIRPGYNAEVDQLRDIMQGGKGMMAGMEAREREATGIRSLKVGYNKVFGYYIEVSKANYDQVPDHYIRKQTLAGCERYVTQELKDMEHSILSAQDKVVALEYQLFSRLRDMALAAVSQIQRSALAVAAVDALNSFATVAAANGYCRPTVDLSDSLDIVDGRHPVVEKTLTDRLFVPNDTHMDRADNSLAIITGPNMAGKSTYMRQVALITLMAQAGSFVPAKSARIGVVDRVFTRIGASDDLGAGQSTFMVEMSEVAEMLRKATGRSLLILDEIGRGTSTYDGMSIARAVLEYCANKEKLGARTLFATHYHELTVLEGALPGVKNFNVAAKKKDDQVVFLRKIVPGAADRSYGIEVAQLAGVPAEVISRAKEVLSELVQGSFLPAATVSRPAPQPGDDETRKALQLAHRLKTTAVDTLTPLEALNLLYQLKSDL